MPTKLVNWILNIFSLHRSGGFRLGRFRLNGGLSGFRLNGGLSGFRLNGGLSGFHLIGGLRDFRLSGFRSGSSDEFTSPASAGVLFEGFADF
jgi:hypothetical protein